jgi:outer membrane lipoprotein-sorting protein
VSYRTAIARLPLLACAAALAALPGSAAESGAEATVRQVSEKYRQLDNYTLEYLDNYSNAGQYHRKVSFMRPDNYHIESLDESVRLIQIINANGSWLYAPDLRQYIFVPGKDKGHPAFEVYTIERLAAHMKSAEFLPDEALNIAGRNINCRVVRVRVDVEPEASATLWIDKEENLVIRYLGIGYLANGLEVRVSETLLSAETTAFLPRDEFIFQPSAGDQQVQSIERRNAGR